MRHAVPGVLKIGQMGPLRAGDHPRVIERLQVVPGDSDGYPLGGFPDRVAVEMRIARGRLDPTVTEQSADDRQPVAERERPRGETVTQVVIAGTQNVWMEDVDFRSPWMSVGLGSGRGTGELDDRGLSAHNQFVPVWKLSVFDDFDDGFQA